MDLILNQAIGQPFKAFYLGFHSVCASNALIVSDIREIMNNWKFVLSLLRVSIDLSSPDSNSSDAAARGSRTAGMRLAQTGS